jgi:hypothetical protein
MAGDVVWGKLLIFGGWDVNNFICNDIYMLSMLPGGAAWERLPVAGSFTTCKRQALYYLQQAGAPRQRRL